jgi:hypothetical protein
MGAHNCKNCGQFHTVNSFVARPDLDQVLAPPQARITCQYCAQSMLDNEYDAHLLNCTMIPVACPWGCGATVIKRDMNSHASACPFYPITCEYCGAQLPSINYYEHKSRHEAERMSGRVPQQQQLVTLPPAQSPQAVATSNYPTTNTSLRTRPQSTQMQAPPVFPQVGVNPTSPFTLFAYFTMFWSLVTGPSALGNPRLVQVTDNFMAILRNNPTFMQVSQYAPTWLRGNHVVVGTGIAFFIWLIFGIIGFLFRLVLGAGVLALVAFGARMYVARR